MASNATFAKASILVASLSCCYFIFAAAPVVADRDASLQISYFQRLRNNRADKQSAINRTQFPYENDEDAKFRARPKSRTRSSIFVRSFILTAVVWTIKFVMPQMVRFLSRWCEDISEFRKVVKARAKDMRHRRNAKSRNDGGDASLAGDTVSMSPSVMEILDLAGDGDDDGSSFISTTSSLSSLFPSLGSFVRSRRRAVASSAAGSNRSRRSAVSTKQTKTKSPKSKPSKLQTYMDGEREHGDDAIANSLPQFLHFIDEDNPSIGDAGEKLRYSKNSKRHRSKDNQKNHWLDDISQLPVTGDSLDTPPYNSKRKQESGSPLERKLSSGSAHDSGTFCDGHAQTNHRQSRKHQSHHHRRHRNKR